MMRHWQWHQVVKWALIRAIQIGKKLCFKFTNKSFLELSAINEMDKIPGRF